jgi:two-component system sensor kinase FixL
MRRLWPGPLAIFIAGIAITTIGLAILSVTAVGHDIVLHATGQKMWAFQSLLVFAGIGMLVALAIGWRAHHDATDAMALHEQMHEKLANTASLLGTIMSATPGLIFAKDLDGRLIMANPAAQTTIGRPWSELEGRTAATYFPKNGQGVAIMANDRRIMDSGSAETCEETFISPGGTPVVHLSTRAPFHGPDGDVIGLVVICMNITERKAVAGKLQILGGELAQLGLRNAMAELSLTLANELNQPLAAIVNHLAIAEHSIVKKALIDDFDITRRLNDATDQAMRAGRIVKQLRGFIDKETRERQPHNVAELVMEAAELISGMARRTGLTIALSMEDRDARIMADRVEIQQAVINMVRNAGEAIDKSVEQNAEISITVRSVESLSVDIIVSFQGRFSNTNSNIEVFEKFSTDRYDEHDLIIPVTLRALERHAGKLSYQNDETGAARIIATLPMY